MAAAHCWMTRYEALGFAEGIDALLAHSPDDVDALATAAGYALTEDPDGGFWYRLDVFNDICMELDGHDGPHSFVKDSDLVLEFV